MLCPFVCQKLSKCLWNLGFALQMIRQQAVHLGNTSEEYPEEERLTSSEFLHWERIMVAKCSVLLATSSYSSLKMVLISRCQCQPPPVLWGFFSQVLSHCLESKTSAAYSFTRIVRTPATCILGHCTHGARCSRPLCGTVSPQGWS